jgi:predicted hydrocarbon binding protein
MVQEHIVKPEELPLHCEGNIHDYEEALHGLMVLNAMIIRSLEEIARGGANAVVYRAGMKLGHETGKYFPKTDNVEKALKELSEILGKQYNFELWKPKGKDSYIITENGETFIYLVFRDCLVRQTLRREGMPQKGPLCQSLYGYMVGAMEEITGKRGKLEIVHVGPNTCLKKLILR